MPDLFRDTTVLITGASRGIGAAFARLLAPRGARLLLVARHVADLERVAASVRQLGGSAEVFPADLAPAEAPARLATAVAARGFTVDHLINNAGIGPQGRFQDLPVTAQLPVIDVNVRAVTALAGLFLPGMVARRRGGILNISSGFGLEYMPGFTAYSASKHFVTALTEGLRVEARPFGVVVSQACPGPVRTEFQEVAAQDFADRKVPSFVEISAEQCARRVVRGFAKGRAIILPGLLIRAGVALGAMTPRWLKRWAYRLVANEMRRHQERRRAAG